MLVQIITEAAGRILSQPLPPVPQQQGPDFVGFLTNAVFALLWSIVASLIFTIVVYVALRIYSTLTPGINEFRELAEGNMAVGMTMAATTLAIAAIVIAILLK